MPQDTGPPAAAAQAAGELVVTFNEAGKLGIKFEKTADGSTTQIKQLFEGGQALLNFANVLQVGLVLTRVQGAPVSHSGVARQIKDAGRPLALAFRLALPARIPPPHDSLSCAPAVRAQAMAALQAMGFKAEECGVALDAADGSVEHACELLVEAAELEAELAARGAAEAPHRRSPRRPAGCDLEPEPEIAAPAGGNYYVGDADCGLADSESSRDDY